MNIKKEFIEFFKSKQHDEVASSSLVPNDPTLMFTNAGMVQFKDIFTGKIKPPTNKRAVSCQLCLRAGGKHNDLENVGFTSRHHTLFEMLGNFSFGDYGKDKAISYAWEFITKVLKLPVDKLWVTVYENDDEAYELWQKYISADHIKKLGDKDNFWSMGDTGACGPCSEIFFDQGAKLFDTAEDYLGGDGDRFLEIWNLVFMQFERDKSGNMTKLPKPSIDTGMGLERVIAIKEGVTNNFDTSIFMPLIKTIETISNTKATTQNISSYRVIADHTKAVAFMLCDGVLFDNEGRGYVLRRILRRAVRHGYLLGLRKPFIREVVDSLVENMSDEYPFLSDKQSYIKEQITQEETRFFKTIKNGMKLFQDELDKTTDNEFDGEIAFKLYDTYGFPLDLTEDMLREHGIKLDKQKFDTCMQEQKIKAKASWRGSGDEMKSGDFATIVKKYNKNIFVGYETNETQSHIIAVLDGEFKEVSDTLSNGEYWVMFAQTPFYATSGGQTGSTGQMTIGDKVVEIVDTREFFGLNLSKIVSTDTNIKPQDKVLLKDININETAKHHTATHLLQAVLKNLFGENITQAGSYNDHEKLRFDFTYGNAIEPDMLANIENKVNELIYQNIANNTKVLPIEQARQTGATAMFGEKYGDEVRVVGFGDTSVEFCGGVHVVNTSMIGSFFITRQSSVSAGVRRIEAVCGKSAKLYNDKNIGDIKKLETILKTKDIITKTEKLLENSKQIKNNKQTNSKQKFDTIDINDSKLIVAVVEDENPKDIIDEQKNKYESIAIFLIQANDESIKLVCGTKNIGIKANEWLKAVCDKVDGKGGGSESFAQGGAKGSKNIKIAKKIAISFVKDNLKDKR